MKNKYELMGQYVQVKAFMKPARKFQRREHIRYNIRPSRVGMVVGYRTVYDGKVEPSHNNCPDDYEPGYLTDIKPIKVILVCFWPTYKPVLVSPEDISLPILFPHKGIHNLQPTVFPYSDRDRENLRKYAKEMKRDAKGRWIK